MADHNAMTDDGSTCSDSNVTDVLLCLSDKPTENDREIPQTPSLGEDKLASLAEFK